MGKMVERTESNGSAPAAEWLLWGKAKPPTDGDGPEWHPLICHMIDVMSVADLIWDRLPTAAREVLQGPFASESDARVWMRLLVALHDAGKATPGFQAKWPGNLEAQADAGLANSREKECHRHGTSGTGLLEDWLMDETLLPGTGLGRRTARFLARCVASHHGEFTSDKSSGECFSEDLSWQLSNGNWREVQASLVGAITEIATRGRELPPWSGDPLPSPGFAIALAGFTTVADWLGSDASVFSYTALPVDVEDYCKVARERAQTVLEKVHWLDIPQTVPRTFVELFPGYAPRSLQSELAHALAGVSEPSLIIIESTMGDGKTEAALMVSESLAPRAGQFGLYVGLPTQATSNQMFGRVRRFLERTAAGRVNLQLVHGDAALSDQFRELKLRAIYGEENRKGRTDAHVTAETWFAQSKRSLLAGHAVGTIDQSLLGVLQTKHFFLRLFGLAGKTVVLDEVHAYDTYTSQLLDRLVAWLSLLGTTVVILSATLPRQRREQLIEAYGASLPEREAPYPRLTLASRSRMAVSVATEASRPTQRIRLERVSDDVETIAASLCTALQQGGTAAWICNTVRRAQEAYSALRRYAAKGGPLEGVQLDLLHSRFLRKDRQRREQTAEQLYGPPSSAGAVNRPHRGILVGTQVLEQSLDLDFDLMVTDLAPIDLVLQRSGRLHRHERSRPAAHRTPVLWLVMPNERDGIPDFRSVAGVYTKKDEDIMLRTWWELGTETELVIPDSLESWVERVYGDAGTRPSDPKLLERLHECERHAGEERRADWRKAENALLFAPGGTLRTDRFGDLSADLVEDEGSEVHEKLRAQTRLAEPSADVVFLWERNGALSFDQAGEQPAALAEHSHANLRRLLEHSVKIELKRLKTFGECATQPPEWRDNAALRFKWLLTLGDESRDAGVELEPELGVMFRLGKVGGRA